MQPLGSAAEGYVKSVIDQAVGGWHANYLRISLYMDSYGTALDWASDTSGYASAMTRIVNYVGTKYPGTYVLLSLRSDVSMNCPNEPNDTASFTPTSIQPSGNILYEVHYYPVLAGGGSDYYSCFAPTLPMLIGEYGDFGSSGSTSAESFFKDMENMQIPSLAWDFDPLNDCAPDLVNTGSVTSATPNAWGQVVQGRVDDEKHRKDTVAIDEVVGVP